MSLVLETSFLAFLMGVSAMLIAAFRQQKDRCGMWLSVCQFLVVSAFWIGKATA